MRAELAVAVEMTALGQQMQVEVAQHRPEPVRVLELLHLSAAPRHPQPVAERLPAPGDARDKDTGGMHPLALADHRARICLDHRHRVGAGQHRPHREPARRLVHAEIDERVAECRRRDRRGLRLVCCRVLRLGPCRRFLTGFAHPHPFIDNPQP